MKKQIMRRAFFTAVGVGTFGLISQATAQISVNGSLAGKTSFYGAPLAVQTIETGFGDSTVGDGTSSGGSELDAAYGNISNGTLYLMFTGNIEGNGTANHLNIFIADSQPNGQNTLHSTTGAIANDNGLVFPAGFNCTYVLDVNDSKGTLYLDQDNLSKGNGGYLGSVPLTGGIGSASNVGGLQVGFNNTNAAGVGGNTGAAANQSAAALVQTGFEVGIPLSALNVSGGTISVLAAVNGGGDSYFSNQFLPGLPTGYGNLGTPSGVDLQTNGANITPISISIPTLPNGTWLPAGGGSWSNGSNWSNSAVPNGPGQLASFTSATAASLVTLDGSYTIGSLTLNSSSSYNISSGTGGGLTFNGNGSNATLNVFAGTHTISAPSTLVSNLAVTVQTFGDGVTLSGNINGSGGLIAVGPGGGIPSLTLSGSNTYTGGTDVEHGNLTLGSAGALPANTALILSAKDVPAGVLDLNGNSASLSSIVVTTSSLTGSTQAMAQIINSNSAAGTVTLTYNGNISNPSIFSGHINDSNGSGGSTTALLINSGSLTLTSTNTYAGSTNVSGGSLTLGAANALPGATNLIIGSGASVIASNLGTENAVVLGSLSDTGKLDLNNNALDIHTTTASAVNALLASGYNRGHWNGATGIVSTTAASDTTHLTALGSIVNDNGSGTPLYGSGGTIAPTFDGATPAVGDLLVKLTYYGDTNLDGVVDGSDYTRIDNGSLNHLTGWSNGDFNYDGVVNGSDYTLIDNAFNTQGASLAALVAGPSAVATAQIAGGSAVPEPASLATLALGAATLLGRRRRVCVGV
jgi:autotransporter-associated beta strand protein